MIRRATLADMPALLEMGAAFHDSLTHGVIPAWSPEAAEVAFAGMLERDDCVFLVATQDGALVGMTAALTAPVWYNATVLSGQEAFWYVDPQAQPGLGRELLGVLEAEMRKLGVQFFSVLSMEGNRAKALARVYQSRGYVCTEHAFIREFDHCQS